MVIHGIMKRLFAETIVILALAYYMKSLTLLEWLWQSWRLDYDCYGLCQDMNQDLMGAVYIFI